MKIAIDATTLCDAAGRPGAGIEHYTWSVLLSLVKVGSEDSFVVIVPEAISAKRESILHTFENVRIVKLKKSKVPFVARHVLLPLRLALRRVDVLFAPAGQIPMGWNGRSVITVHDAIIFEHPEWFPDSSTESFATKKIVPRSIRETDKIIAVSKATHDQLLRVFPEAKDKIEVIHEGVNIPAEIQPLSLRFQSLLNNIEDVLLFLGTIEPRKNLLNTLHAFHRFLEIHPQRAPVTRLLLAGAMGWKTNEIEAAIQDVNRVWQARAQGDVVQVVGYIMESEKWSLLDRASALLFMSHQEGFGLPLIEAMGVGTSVIASKIPALVETGADTVFYVEPEDPEAAALTIAQCLLVPEGLDVLKQAGIKRAEQFNWQEAAEKTLRVIHGIGRQQKKSPKALKSNT